MMQPARSAEGGATAVGAASGATVGYYRPQGVAHPTIDKDDLPGLVADERALSDSQGAQFTQLLKKARIVAAGNETLIADLDANEGFTRFAVTHLYDGMADEQESDGEGDEDDPDFEGESDDRPGRYAPRASSTSPAPGGAAKRLRIGPAPQPAAEEEEHEQEQCV
ncbi:hypothetical protein M885DRAFT_574059 [Pelagophyceae sp. CCMP2097]|nr:hypothetical protein M885DRAFT_574059 [Pelagophyceae sp. CCMP2097]